MDDSLQESVDLIEIIPVLYYTISNYIEEGNFYKIEKSEFHPEYIIVHKNDLERVKEYYSKDRILVDMKEYKFQINPFQFRYLGDSYIEYFYNSVT